ncbi:hypothetical protein Taro_038717 [Colocasia esculenta]|uniref:Uncharacterized protein n=1 Tax=Colocasia esculenta TaxID=4460 RepID=A0A843WTH4_COLES|nr:hypothetical protein [Colocasia esculenta]
MTTASSPPPGARPAAADKSHLGKRRDELHNRSLIGTTNLLLALAGAPTDVLSLTQVQTYTSRQSEAGHKVHNSNRHSLAGLRSHMASLRGSGAAKSEVVRRRTG